MSKELITAASTPQGNQHVAIRDLGFGKCRAFSPFNQNPDPTDVFLDTDPASANPTQPSVIPDFTPDFHAELGADGAEYLDTTVWDAEVLVYNVSACPIPANLWFTATYIGGLLVATLPNFLVFCKTSPNGIPARSGTQSGDDVCKVQTIDESGAVIATEDEVTVYNPWSTAVAGSTYISATPAYQNVLIVSAEDCQ